MKKFFQKTARQCVWFVIKWLSKLELWLNRHNNPNPNGYENLTPIANADESEKYSEVLAWALKNKNIRNIAISGAFGSGKSSILRTFEKKNRAYEYLNVKSQQSRRSFVVRAFYNTPKSLFVTPLCKLLQ